MRTGGPVSAPYASSATIETISAPQPHSRGFSSTVNSRPVLATSARIVRVSSGTSDRTSTTVTSMPCPDSCSAAVMARGTMAARARIVASRPCRSTLARPSSSTTSPSGTSPLLAIRPLCSKKIDRIGITDGRGEQPDDVTRARRGDDLQARHGHGPVLHRLGVLGPEPHSGPVGAADDQRQRQLAVGHVPDLGHLVGDQVPADREEIAEHDLGDRPQAGHRGADRGPEDGLLADRGVTDPAPGRTPRAGRPSS